MEQSINNIFWEMFLNYVHVFGLIHRFDQPFRDTSAFYHQIYYTSWTCQVKYFPCRVLFTFRIIIRSSDILQREGAGNY
jgi:hypothetical protein